VTPQIWPPEQGSAPPVVVLQLPAVQTPETQIWFAPYSLVQSPSAPQAWQNIDVVLQIWFVDVQSPLARQFPGTQVPGVPTQR